MASSMEISLDNTEDGGESPTGANWSVYIDGLNFYAAVRYLPDKKWVDFRALAARLIPHTGTVNKVKYFTSQISAKAAEDPDAPRRQRVFIRAIRATGVEVLEGKFKVPDDWRTVSSVGNWKDRFRPPPPSAMLGIFRAHFVTHETRPWKARVELPREKFTDVAIASHLLRDFYQGICSHAIVLSNDSDLRPAIELAVEDGHHVGVFSPVSTVSRDLTKVASWAKPIRPGLLEQCQMPDEVRVPGSSRMLSRPAAWK
ncbi:MAG: NYN domain-containing protein [bacterium]|nr:NYN domain-containing protein [bacterium]